MYPYPMNRVRGGAPPPRRGLLLASTVVAWAGALVAAYVLVLSMRVLGTDVGGPFDSLLDAAVWRIALPVVAGAVMAGSIFAALVLGSAWRSSRLS